MTTVQNMLKKAVLLNAELLSAASEKLKDMADEFVTKNTNKDNDAKRFVSEVREKLNEREKDLSDKVEKITNASQEIFHQLGFGPKAEAEAIEGRIGELEKQLEELKARKEAAKKEPVKKEAAAATK